jgi:hypothetical protein
MVRGDLRDPAIAGFYLGVDPRQASDADYRAARERFGDPLGPPRVMGDGAVRQPFERAVLERPDPSARDVRLGPIGRIAIDAGVVPASARRPASIPNLGLPEPMSHPSRVRPFLQLLALVALAWAAGALVGAPAGAVVGLGALVGAGEGWVPPEQAASRLAAPTPTKMPSASRRVRRGVKSDIGPLLESLHLIS